VQAKRIPTHQSKTVSLRAMIRVVTVVGQIMGELKGAVSEKAKIMAITNTVFNLLQEYDK
jgi:hypothetical protein